LVYTQIQTVFGRFSEKRIIFAENIHCFMMTKQEHIDHWVRTAAEDRLTVEALFTTERYMHCLFWSHLTLEKLAKAHWVKNHDNNIPPKVHNIVWLLDKSGVDLGNESFSIIKPLSGLYERFV
jgi:HEPN domain-containing protein